MNATLRKHGKYFRGAGFALGTVLAALASAPAFAQPPEEPCADTDLIAECLENRQDSTAARDAEETAIVSEVATREIAAGTTSLNLTDLSSFGDGALRPFLETFLAQIDGFSTSGGDDEALKLTYTAPNQKVSGEAIFHQAEVSDTVLELYPEDGRDAVESGLEKGLDNLDDVEAKVLLNYCGRLGGHRFGRRVKDYRDLLTTLVREAVTPALADPEVRKVLERGLVVLGAPVPKANAKVADLTWGQLKADGDPVLVEQVRAFLLGEDAVRILLASHQGFLREVEASRVDELYDLIANQPQMYLELGGRFRDEAVGPDTWSAKYVWEMPAGRNVNQLEDYCTGTGAVLTLSCYRQYMALPDTTASLRAKDRWKLELAGEGIADWEYRDGTTGEILLDRGSDVKATLAAAYSRVLRYVEIRNEETGELEEVEASRFDAEVAGEYVDNEEIFQRRFKGTLTLTNRINDDFDAALSFVWASEPEFRDEVDKEFSARAGIRFKVGQTGGGGG